MLSFSSFFELNSANLQGVNYAVWAGGHDDIGVAGTSCASPTAAGVFSLINDKRLAAGKPTLGFMNPLLYKSKPYPVAALQPLSSLWSSLASSILTKRRRRRWW